MYIKFPVFIRLIGSLVNRIVYGRREIKCNAIKASEGFIHRCPENSPEIWLNQQKRLYMVWLQEVAIWKWVLKSARAQWGFSILFSLLTSFPFQILKFLRYQEYFNRIISQSKTCYGYDIFSGKILNLCDSIERLGFMYILIILIFNFSLG